jgi:L-fucose isomerase-like protein
MNRREFGLRTAAGAAATFIAGNTTLEAKDTFEDWDPDRPLTVTGQPLRVQPVLLYNRVQRRDQTSWRGWGSINNPEAAAQEGKRIAEELKLISAADIPVQFLPLLTVTNPDEARKVHGQSWDAVLLYPATGSAQLLTACFAKNQPVDTLIFVRHQSGPTYYWYEALSTRILKTPTEPELARNSAANHGPPTVQDVIVDDLHELHWRLRALYALKNFIGQRIVALGGPQGKYDPQAPKVAREKYRMEIIDVSYEELGRRLQEVRADKDLMTRVQKWTNRYLAQPGTTLTTKKPFVANAFLLYAIFKGWLRQHRAGAFTIQSCMSTVIPMAETTACMPLSWMNDEGLLAFCESDFVIIPPGVFLHFASGRPVFLHNSTFPHGALVTCAHCTAPRRMDGKKYEPTEITTHYESDYGAAPKVDMKIGQEVTFIDPEYSTGRWLGFKGIIKANPCHAICRTQQDVEILGDWQKLVNEVRDSHWVMVYGDCLRELGYAARKIGINWVDISGR